MTISNDPMGPVLRRKYYLRKQRGENESSFSPLCLTDLVSLSNQRVDQ